MELTVISSSKRAWPLAAAAALVTGCVHAQPVTLPPAPAGVQTSVSFGIQFSTIAAPGNRAANQSELLFYPDGPHPDTYGVVNYAYRLARTELTYGQLYQMIRAYAPVSAMGDSLQYNVQGGIGFLGGNPNDPDQYVLNPVAANAPANFTVGLAAMYCNWLQNNQATTAEAFYSGVYDLHPWIAGGPLGPLVRSPNAQYWIPTVDEWTKGMHYDLNRYGPGQDGYWWYPFMSNTEAVSGLPGTGAQSDFGLPFGSGPTPPVGAYPNAASPWGLFGGSGGASEFVIDRGGYFSRGTRAFLGSPFLDIIDMVPTATTWNGLRIASVVPAPGTFCAFVLASAVGLRRARTTIQARPSR